MRAVVLFSGSLESLLTARLLQNQGVDPIALFFRTACSRREPPAELAGQLGLQLIVLQQDEPFAEAVRHPTLGRTKNAAACLDCRVRLLARARETMEAEGAAFVATGEVLGQRPRSQNRCDLEAVAHHAGLDDLLIRPLSAKLLDETRPEREKWIDRERLFAFHGKARGGLIDLAKTLGLKDLPPARPECGLADVVISARVFDYFRHQADNNAATFQLLEVGRHYRFDGGNKVILGRNADENVRLIEIAAAGKLWTAVATNFRGPVAVVDGDFTAELRAFVAGLIRHLGKPEADEPVVEFQREGGVDPVRVAAAVHPQAITARAIGT